MSQSAYSLDTNSILTAWNQTYRPSNFAGFWKRMQQIINEGRARISEEVERELSRKDDAAYGWVKERDEFVVPLEENQARLAKALTSEFPTLAKERLGRMRADGFVMALAQWKGLTVVTAENRRGPEKIPNICEAKNIECISLADMIEREDWTFS